MSPLSRSTLVYPELRSESDALRKIPDEEKAKKDQETKKKDTKRV
jgi:hypothetical protein